MRRETLSGLSVTITGGTDREGGGDGPLVVLLHGFGAPGEDLVPLFRQLNVPSEVRFAFPAAPVDLRAKLGPGYAGGRAWWMIDTAALEAPAPPAPPVRPAAPRSREVVICHVCGDIMQRAGSCHACPSCGATSGCS